MLYFILYFILFYTVFYTILYCILYYFILYFILFCTILYYFILFYTIFIFYASLYYFILYLHSTLFYTIFTFYTILYYILHTILYNNSYFSKFISATKFPKQAESLFQQLHRVENEKQWNSYRSDYTIHIGRVHAVEAGFVDLSERFLLAVNANEGPTRKKKKKEKGQQSPAYKSAGEPTTSGTLI